MESQHKLVENGVAQPIAYKRPYVVRDGQKIALSRANNCWYYTSFCQNLTYGEHVFVHENDQWFPILEAEDHLLRQAVHFIDIKDEVEYETRCKIMYEEGLKITGDERHDAEYADISDSEIIRKYGFTILS